MLFFMEIFEISLRNYLINDRGNLNNLKALIGYLSNKVITNDTTIY